MIGLLRDKFLISFKKFAVDKEYRETIRTSVVALLVRLIGVSTGFFLTLLTSRLYGADALGIVSICIGILSFASVFARMGLDVAVMKFIAGYASDNRYGAIKGIYIHSLKILVPFSIIISLLLYFGASLFAITFFHKPFLENILRINAWLTLPLVLLLFNSECLRGLKKIGAYTFFQTVSVSLFALLFVASLATLSRGNTIPVKVQFVSITISSVISLVIWIRHSKFITTAPVYEMKIPALFNISSTMFTTTFMQLLMSWAGTLILAAHVSESEVGVYNALVRISVFTNITILAVNSLAMPRFAEAYASKDFPTMERHSSQSARLIFISSIPIFIVLAVLPHQVLSVFGREFPGNENSLYILLAGQLIICFCGLPGQILNMAGRQHILRNVSLVSAVVNVLLCILLIPAYGIQGACFSQLAGSFVWCGLCVLSVKRHFGFYTFFRPRRSHGVKSIDS